MCRPLDARNALEQADRDRQGGETEPEGCRYLSCTTTHERHRVVAAAVGEVVDGPDLYRIPNLGAVVNLSAPLPGRSQAEPA